MNNQEQSNLDLDWCEEDALNKLRAAILTAQASVAAVRSARSLFALRDAAIDAFDAAAQTNEAAEELHDLAREMWRRRSPQVTLFLARAVREGALAAMMAKDAGRDADSRAVRLEMLRDERRIAAREMVRLGQARSEEEAIDYLRARRAH